MANQLSITEKREIQYRLRVYVNTFSSQKRACESLKDCSEATVIAILNENEFGWDKIADGMWRNVASQLGGSVDFTPLVETLNFETLFLYFTLAQERGSSFAIVGDAGWGKTYAAKWFSTLNRKKNVFYIECPEYCNKKMFLTSLLIQMGRNSYGMQIGEMMQTIVRDVRRMATPPLIILDEIDKLPDPVLKFFITLYNELNKKCGFVWLSTNAIEKRIIRGLERNTVGYKELFSRIGATFINLNKPTVDEIAEICRKNGITDVQQVAKVCNEVSQVNGDLRRVDRNIDKHYIKSIRRRIKTTAA